MSSSRDPVIVEVTLAATVELAWRAWTDPVEMNRWFEWDYEGHLDDIKNMLASGAGKLTEHELIEMPDGSRVIFEPRGQQTVMRITKPAPAEGVTWDDVYYDDAQGWTAFVQQLRFALERHPGEDRRTIALVGDALEPETTPIPVLGLEDVAALDVGERYRINVAPGDEISGEIWSRSKFGLALTVEFFGDGLIVINQKPASEQPPHGGASACLTTYGLDEVTFQDIRERWAKTWHAHYKTNEFFKRYGAV